MENYNSSEFEKYQQAKKQVQEIRGFYGHLISFISVMLFLLFINLKYSEDHLWFYWPMLGWGIGILFHAMKVFNIVPFFGKDWEERKIKEFMEQERKNQNKNK